MQIHRDITKLPQFTNAVITIGTFDGVHLGHRQIIDNLKAEAVKANGESVIITFHPHPRKVVSSVITGVRLINTLNERIELLAKTGIDHLVIVPFTEYFANQEAEDYISDFLVAKFNPHTIIIGYDHRFGKERAGDYKLMEDKATKYNYQLKEIPEHILHTIKVSSTNIRNAILHGNIDEANEFLGYDFFFEGEVFHNDFSKVPAGTPDVIQPLPRSIGYGYGDGGRSVMEDLERIGIKATTEETEIKKKK